MGDDMQRGSGYHHMRKAFADKGQNYSPSASYNYNPGGGHGQNTQGQHPRRRTDRFKRELVTAMERLGKQNETIIKLLREIRDRLGSGEGGEPSSVGQDTATSAPVQDQDNVGNTQDDYDDEDDGF